MDTQVPDGSQGRYRRFSSQQKLEILKEWERSGNGTEVSRKHGIPPSRLYRWKKQLEHGADEFLRGGRPTWTYPGVFYVAKVEDPDESTICALECTSQTA